MSKELLEKLAEVTVTQREILTNQGHVQKLLDKHTEILEEQGKTLIRNTITVEEHHRRSLYLEEEQKALKAEVHSLKTTVETENSNRAFLKSIVISAGYVFTAIGAAGGVLWGIYNFLKGLGV
jgi:hypothetical protein